MKKILALSIVLNSAFISAGYSSVKKCVPEYVASVLQKGKHTTEGDWLHQDRLYKLWINEKKMTAYDREVEKNLNAGTKENITTTWHPAKDKTDKSSEYCEFTIADSKNQMTGKLFPYPRK